MPSHDTPKDSKHSPRPNEQHPHAGKSERNVDAMVEDTFPASDAPSIGGVTRIKPKTESSDSRPEGGKDADTKHKHH